MPLEPGKTWEGRIECLLEGCVRVVQDGLVVGFLEVEGHGLEDGPDCVEATD